jgi:hypothetical protein
VGQLVAEVIFQELSQQAVAGAARGGQALQSFRAGFAGSQGVQDAFGLTDNFFGAVQKFRLAFRHSP